MSRRMMRMPMLELAIYVCGNRANDSGTTTEHTGTVSDHAGTLTDDPGTPSE